MPKAKGAASPQSLHIRSKSMTKSLDKVLSNGCGTVLVVLASWCGACKRALPMWLKQLKKKNEKNVVLLDNELLSNTSLNGSLNITHFPSTFEIPAGGKPTLLENPQNLESMEMLVNSPEKKADAPPPTVISAAEYVNRNNSPKSFESLSRENNTSFPNTLSQKSPFMTPQGFTPSMGPVESLNNTKNRTNTKNTKNSKNLKNLKNLNNVKKGGLRTRRRRANRLTRRK